MDELGWGIIGCGVIAPSHARAVQAVSGARLVAVADAIPERAARLGAEFGVEALPSIEALLARPDIQVVSLCVPSGQHGVLGERVAAAGKHILCEKPLEITLPAADRLISAARANQVKLAVISQNRFAPAVLQIRAAQAAGRFGRLIFGGAYIPWYRTQGYYDSGAWRGTWALDGGGCLMNQGIHYIDLLQWIMGPVASVVAQTGTLAHRIEVEDLALAVLRFQSGALGLIQGSTAIYPGLPERLEIAGEGGTAVVTAGQLTVWELKDERGETTAYGRPLSPPAPIADQPAAAGASHVTQVADLIAAIRDERTPAIAGEAARQPLEIILAIYQSAREGRAIELPLSS